MAFGWAGMCATQKAAWRIGKQARGWNVRNTLAKGRMAHSLLSFALSGPLGHSREGELLAHRVSGEADGGLRAWLRVYLKQSSGEGDGGLRAQGARRVRLRLDGTGFRYTIHAPPWHMDGVPLRWRLFRRAGDLSLLITVHMGFIITVHIGWCTPKLASF